MAFDFRKWFGVDEKYYYEEDEMNEEQYVQDEAVGDSQAARPAMSNATRPTQSRRPNVISMEGARTAGATSPTIALFEPRTRADEKAIADMILQGEAVIINFNSIDEKQGVRILDYINGTIHAVDGVVERVSDRIFLATPRNFEISGAIAPNLNHND